MENHHTAHPDNQTLLRRTLKANAFFSALAGLALAAEADAIAALAFTGNFHILGFSAADILLEAGLGLVLFAALVYWTARRPRINLRWAKIICALDAFWVADSFILLIVASGLFTALGMELVIFQALAVLAFAVLEAVGIVRAQKGITARSDPPAAVNPAH